MGGRNTIFKAALEEGLLTLSGTPFQSMSSVHLEPKDFLNRQELPFRSHSSWFWQGLRHRAQ